ncbi:syndecan-1 [Sturnira hondurensis]|uniref:syndecan-1 n=1 Tax=Sturnira hondurensis TaxID=192404 RepID=UPI00187AD9EB|nr:syndecan-1 [Sturnira hondurensis]XP_036891322.1 syndecan-1 [Sturnira hondurensis]
MRRAALCFWLCALALRLQPVLPQLLATNVPPEDQDGSGDDSDSFSGSGAGALQDIILSQRNPSTWKDLALLTVTPTAPEPTDIGPITASTSILPAIEGDKEGDTVFLAKVEPDFTSQEKTALPPSETTPHPTTYRVSTTRAATAQAPVTSHLHRDMQPDHPKTLAPRGAGQLDPHMPSVEDGGPSAHERAAEEKTATHFSVGEGSGEQDFTFDVSGEITAGPVLEVGPRNELEPEPDRGASQGLLDRKEVLGGVIAGGLVGLIFAVCLVGFMLYRMKKKDEGSYSLEEPKQANGGAYQKPSKQEEFYA